MKTIFLQDAADLDAQYARLLPVFERVPAVPEYRPEQLFDLARAGRAVIGYCEEDGEITLAVAFEFIHYPDMTSLNIIALAGAHLTEVAGGLLEKAAVFARAAGADCIEALCTDGMARLLTRHGFCRSAIQMRMEV